MSYPKMKTIAIGGLLYPISKFLSPWVTSYEVKLFGQPNLFASIESAIKATNEPVRIVGFSRGATFALSLFQSCRNVLEVYAHSPGEPPRIGGRGPRIDGVLRFFRTEKDKIGSVYRQTGEAFRLYESAGHPDVLIRDLPFSRIETRRNIEQKMNRYNHVFHNCLPHLPREILR